MEDNGLIQIQCSAILVHLAPGKVSCGWLANKIQDLGWNTAKVVQLFSEYTPLCDEELVSSWESERDIFHIEIYAIQKFVFLVLSINQGKHGQNQFASEVRKINVIKFVLLLGWLFSL